MPERPPPRDTAANTPILKKELTSLDSMKAHDQVLRERARSQPDLAEAIIRRTEQVQRLRIDMENGRITRRQFDAIVGAAMAEKEIEADIDSLTQLPNRGAVSKRAQEIFGLSSRTDEPVTVAIIDLDRFKVINDIYGHQTGDAVLQQAAGSIVGNKRIEDVAARWGGEEFVLILPNTTSEEAGALINRLIGNMPDEVNEALQGMGYVIDQRITASVGISDNTRRETFEETLAQADKALYHAKDSGRNRAVIIDSQQDDEDIFIDVPDVVE